MDWRPTSARLARCELCAPASGPVELGQAVLIESCPAVIARADDPIEKSIFLRYNVYLKK